MFEVEQLLVKAGDFLLGPIDLRIKRGQTHVIVGPTGSGKTVLLEAAIGLRTVQKGLVRIDGKDITRVPLEKRRISYVPQDLALFPHLSVKDNIYYGLRVARLQNTPSREVALKLIFFFVTQ